MCAGRYCAEAELAPDPAHPVDEVLVVRRARSAGRRHAGEEPNAGVDRLTQRVLGADLRRGGQPQQLVLRESVGGRDRCHRRLASRQCARLVEHYRVDLAGHLQRFAATVDSIGFGVTPNPDLIGKLQPGFLPDVQRTLNWVHLATRYPVRVRVENPPPDLFRIAESAVVKIRGR